MNKQVETFLFNPPTNLVEEGKWLLAVTNFQATKSVFVITDENNSFSISTPGHWSSEKGEELINILKRLMKDRSKIDMKYHVEEVRKRGTQIKIGDKE